MCRDRLITGSSGLALALMQDRGKRGAVQQGIPAYSLEASYGLQAVISGSCSEVTRKQIAVAAQAYPLMRIDPLAIAAGVDVVDETLS